MGDEFAIGAGDVGLPNLGAAAAVERNGAAANRFALGAGGEEVRLRLESSGALTFPQVEAGGDRAEGIGNISLGARHPVYQYVSKDDFVDNTLVAGFEVGIPSNSSISKNTEFVPKLIDDLRLGEHFSLQTVLGYSLQLGPRPEGGKHTFEYAAVLGYSFERQDLPLPGIERLIPILELKGETGLNKGEAGHNSLTGTFGVRLNLKSIGVLQPRLGVGYVFPIDKGARDDFQWGVVTSLVFEF